MKPQVALLLSVLRDRPDGITSLEALHAGIGSRLAARVADLRAEGYAIDSELVRVEGGARVARYTLRRPVQAVYRGRQEPLF